MKAPLLYFPFVILFISAILISPFHTIGQFPGLTVYNVNDGLPGSSIYGTYQDKYGYLWVGGNSGVSRFDGRQFVNYSLSDGLPSLVVEKVFQDSHGRLWVGTSAGIVQFKNNRFISYPTNDNQDITYVFSIIETNAKRLWAITDRGVYEFANNIWNKVHLYPGYENSACRNVVEDNGELYVNYGTEIVCRNKEGAWMHIASDKNFASIFNVISLQNNEILVSTVSNIYKVQNHLLIPVLKKNIRDKNFFSFLVDRKNRLWIAREHFLKISNPSDWNNFRDSINLNANISDISED